jgi:hypothetical protein
MRKLKYIINPFAFIIGCIGMGCFYAGEFFIYLSDELRR